MASGIELTVGKDYEITLQGTRRWVRVARVCSVSADAVVLQLAQGHNVTVPRTAITSALPVAHGQPLQDKASRVESAVVEQVPVNGSAIENNAQEFYLTHFSGHGGQFSAASLLDLRTKILDEIKLVPDANEPVYNAMASALDSVAREWLENDFEKHARAHRKARQNLESVGAVLDAAIANGLKLPNYFRTLLSQLIEAVDAERDRYLHTTASSPDFVNIGEKERFYVGQDQTFLLPVSVSLPAGDAPVESLQLVVHRTPDIRAVGTTGFLRVLQPGQIRELVQRVKVSDLALGMGETVVKLSLRYRCASGQPDETSTKSFCAILEPARNFRRVPNPYSHYSGGAPVQDQDMFFGRKELLERIYDEVTKGPLGQCFVLYGQKRSGKSSILRQLENRLRPPNLPIYLSLGAIDTAEAQRSFVQACIDTLYERLVFDFGMTDIIKRGGWPSDRQVARSPIESFRRAVRASTSLLQSVKNWRDVRPIFLIDEFTYVYEYIREGLLSKAFMRQWKSLLETRTFDAVLVGQDTMPRFKNEYPNEFGVTYDERVSYLNPAEARELADKPIMLGAESRYKGAALERLIELTAGSPFYLQIFCDRIVQYLNRNRHVFVTEYLIGEVLDQLVSGHTALSSDKFDPLITAAGESVALYPRASYLSLLSRLALDPDTVSRNLGPDDAPLVHDLIEREVLARDNNGRLRIRVSLFAEWLRSNSVGIGA
jgi:hypothetical protein